MFKRGEGPSKGEIICEAGFLFLIKLITKYSKAKSRATPATINKIINHKEPELSSFPMVTSPKIESVQLINSLLSLSFSFAVDVSLSVVVFFFKSNRLHVTHFAFASSFTGYVTIC